MIDFQPLRAEVFNTDGTLTRNQFRDVTDVPGLLAGIENDTSAIVAQGRVSVTARYLNINGLIQSGVDEVIVNIDSDFSQANTTTSLLDSRGRPLPGITFGSGAVSDVPVDGYFDATQGAIVLENINPTGGEITLAGQVLSTGNGRLVAALSLIHI